MSDPVVNAIIFYGNAPPEPWEITSVQPEGRMPLVQGHENTNKTFDAMSPLSWAGLVLYETRNDAVLLRAHSTPPKDRANPWVGTRILFTNAAGRSCLVLNLIHAHVCVHTPIAV